jgi:micrococcal nuclease
VNGLRGGVGRGRGGTVRAAYRWLGALVLVLGLGTAAMVAAGLLVARTAEPTRQAGEDVVVPVVRVVDGDTLRVEVDGVTERLRVIGLDAPELGDGECLAEESTTFVQSLVADRRVRIAADPTQADRDRFDRILRHVWTLDGRKLAVEVIAAGLATEYTYAAPYVGVEEHRAAEVDARAAGRGIWGPRCAAASG